MLQPVKDRGVLYWPDERRRSTPGPPARRVRPAAAVPGPASRRAPRPGGGRRHSRRVPSAAPRPAPPLRGAARPGPLLLPLLSRLVPAPPPAAPYPGRDLGRGAVAALSPRRQ